MDITSTPPIGDSRRGAPAHRAGVHPWPAPAADRLRCRLEAGVPGCGTGPLGRLRFVISELAALWRPRRTTTLGSTPTPCGPIAGSRR